MDCPGYPDRLANQLALKTNEEHGFTDRIAIPYPTFFFFFFFFFSIFFFLFLIPSFQSSYIYTGPELDFVIDLVINQNEMKATMRGCLSNVNYQILQV